MNKITEYFQSNPTKESVIVKSAADNKSKVFWRAVREGANRFKITEVSTNTDTFMFQIAETSSAFNDLSKAFMDAVSSPSNPAALTNALKLMGTKQGMLDDPGEQQRADAMLSNLSALAKSSSVATKLKKPMGASSASQIEGEGLVQEAPASPAFQKASTLFTNSIGTFDHNAMSSALKQMNALVSQITDPVERNNFGTMMGGLTSAIDSSTAGGGNAVDMKNAPKTTKPSGIFQNQGGGQHKVDDPDAGMTLSRNGSPLTNKKPNPQAPKPRKLPVQTKGKLNTSHTRSGRSLRESTEFQRASTLFMQVMAPPFDHNKLSTALRQINQMVGSVKDDAERQNMGVMLGTLTNLVDATTAGGGSPTNMRGGGGGSARLTTARTRSGKAVHEASNFGSASKEFLSAMTPPFDHKRIVTAWKRLGAMTKDISEPEEQSNLQIMTRELARMADQTSPAKQIAKQPEPQGDDAPNALNTALARFGSTLGEAEKKKKPRTIRMKRI